MRGDRAAPPESSEAEGEAGESSDLIGGSILVDAAAKAMSILFFQGIFMVIRGFLGCYRD